MVDQQQRVFDWLKAGAVWKDGVLLFRAIFGKNHPFITLIRKEGSEIKYQILKQSLTCYANILQGKAKQPEQKPAPKLRDDFPFLNDPKCPAELKILAADKLTAYHAYVTAYPKFFDCVTNEDYYEVASQVVENYIKNRHILKEFDYYKEHHKVLGQHPVFKLRKLIAEFKKMKVSQLIVKRKNLSHNIWRIKSEIAKGNRPDLNQARKESIEFKELQIIEIDRILEPYV